MNVFADGGGQTSATIGFPSSGAEMTISCPVPTEHASWGRLKSNYR